jgi:hypothetical protein
MTKENIPKDQFYFTAAHTKIHEACLTLHFFRVIPGVLCGFFVSPVVKNLL